MEERDFKGVWIPKEIWLDKRLNVLDKVVLTEIDSLDVGDDGCFASNEYLADFCQCTETKISLTISKLIKLELLEVIKFDGRKRYLKSRLKEIYRQPLKKLKADFKKIKDINIDNNITNNINNINNKNKFVKPTLEEIEKYIKEKNLNVNASTFFQYFEEGNWIDSKGNKVKNWKQKLITWNRYGTANINENKKFKNDVNDGNLDELYEN